MKSASVLAAHIVIDDFFSGQLLFPSCKCDGCHFNKIAHKCKFPPSTVHGAQNISLRRSSNLYDIYLVLILAGDILKFSGPFQNVEYDFFSEVLIHRGNVTRNDAIVSTLIADVAARVAHPFVYESPLRRRGF